MAKFRLSWRLGVLYQKEKEKSWSSHLLLSFARNDT